MSWPARRRGWVIRRALLAADLAGLTCAFVVAEFSLGRGYSWRESLLFVAFLPIWVLIAKISGLYDHDEERANHSTTDDLVGVFLIVTLIAWLYERGSILTGLDHPDTVRLTIFWAVAALAITLGRAVARAIVRRWGPYTQKTIILGAGEIGQLIAAKFLRHLEYGIEVVGFVDSLPKERRDDLEALTILGSMEELDEIIGQHGITRVVVAFSNDNELRLVSLIRSLREKDIQIDVVPRLFEVIGSGFDVHAVEGLPLIGLRPARLSRFSLLLKRATDLALSVSALILLAPIFAIIAIAIKRSSPGPVFFRQLRMGAKNKTFLLYKFRTMIADADLNKQQVAHLNKHAEVGDKPTMFKIVDDPRITPLGRTLRRYSLDELPQLLNVIRGEMSLVGPRPLILDEDRYVIDWARKRLDIKPGITGPWQVYGRANIPFQEMLQIDYTYVTRWSLYGDVKLILRTIPAVLLERGAY